MPGYAHGKGAGTQAEGSAFNSNLPRSARPSLAGMASPWEMREGSNENPKEEKGAQ